MNDATIREQMRIAAKLRQEGNDAAAAQVYEKILAANPNHASSLYYLALIVSASGRCSEAAAMLRRAITLEPGQAAHQYALANVLADLGEIDAALSACRRAIALKPGFAQAHNQIALLYQKSGKNEDAEKHFRLAVQCDPRYAKAHNNLGIVLKGKMAIDEAIACFHEAVRLQPDYFTAHVNLGEMLQLQGKLAEASESFRAAIQLKPLEFDPLLKLGLALIVDARMDQAESALRRALALKPDDVNALVNLARALNEQGNFDEALATYRKAIAVDETILIAAIGANLSLPQIYRSTEQIAVLRKKYAEGLDKLRAQADLFKQAGSQAMTLIWGNFLLAYQGLNDKDLQTRYGEFLTELLRSDGPEFFKPLAKFKAPPGGRRLRIGFLSSMLRSCTVGSYFKSWITGIDKRRLEIFVYYTGAAQDSVTKEIAEGADHFAHLIGLTPGIARRVKKDSLDILVYPEIGMDEGVCIIAALRLAPIQCAAWGHPVTSGYPNIDYFISSALMEPENAADHYSEQLVLLDGLGTCYERPAPPPMASRKEFGLPEDRTLYLCPQSLFKIHPDNDALMAGILQADPKGMLVFFQGMFGSVTDLFLERLEKEFKARGIDTAGRVIFLPRAVHANYLKVNRLCDVMLDTLHWSGGNTSLDAIVCGLPIVTLPGVLMRGRQSFGMLSAMGLTELIAHDEQEYVSIALRLGRDPEWRARISQRIEANTDRIFGRLEPIRDLERFFLSFATVDGGE